MTDESHLDERIRASLTRRAEAVQVAPDLDGLAKRAEPRRSGVQRFPLVAVAVVIAALAVTTAVLRPAPDRDSHLISLSGNQRDRTEDPRSSTSGATSTSGSSRSTSSSSTTSTMTTTTTVPTTVQPPESTTPPTLPAGDPGGGTGTTPTPVPGDPVPCAPVEGELLASVSWEGDVVLVVEFGRNQTLRHLTVWRDAGGSDACPERVRNTSGEPFVLSRPTPGNAQFEVHAIGCSPPRFEAVDGFSDDGVTWSFSIQTYVLNGLVVTLIGDRNSQYVEPGDRDTIESLRQTNCGVLEGGG